MRKICLSGICACLALLVFDIDLGVSLPSSSADVAVKGSGKCWASDHMITRCVPLWQGACVIPGTVPPRNKFYTQALDGQQYRDESPMCALPVLPQVALTSQMQSFIAQGSVRLKMLCR